MRWWVPRCVGLVCAVAVGAVITPGAARAQIGNAVNPIDNPGGLLEQGARMAPETNTQHSPLPPALPGAASRPGSAAPATRIPADMSPNDALFDAINRGDVAAARDAMSRGAELSARNVLGMTPMELSVDLGRNDISFLLLSYRGGSDNGGGAQTQATDKVAALTAGRLGAKPSRGAAHAIRTASRRRAPVARTEPRVGPPAASQTPRLFANDGGAPVPSAGFVGFGSGGR
jgi:hypothetical protein